MSIIHEALKKTQEIKALSENSAEQMNKARVHPADARVDLIREAHPQKPSLEEASESPIFWRAFGVTSLLGLFLVGVVGASSIFHFQSHIKAPHLFSHQAIKPPQYAQNKVKPMLMAPEHLVLNGIMLEGQHRVAVINDQIYQVGDQIEDKKITGIAFDHVSLQNSQNRFELKTRV